MTMTGQPHRRTVGCLFKIQDRSLPVGQDLPAGDHLPGIPGGLAGQVIGPVMYDQSVPDRLLRNETACVEKRQRIAAAGE